MSRRLAIVAVVSLCTVLWVAGCDQDVDAGKSAGGQGAQPSKAEAESPKPQPTGEAPSAGQSKSKEPTTNQDAKGAGAKLVLTGLTMSIPDGWIQETAKPGPMAAKAVFKLSGVEGDPTGGFVRITHFPGMKGMDKQNIDRWISQVRQPNGQPSTRENGKLTVTDQGAVRLTVVDITGSLNTSMGAQTEGKPNHRLIAAIVDHPQGPHFVKASGSVACMKKWEASILAFLESAQVN